MHIKLKSIQYELLSSNAVSFICKIHVDIENLENHNYVQGLITFFCGKFILSNYTHEFNQLVRNCKSPVTSNIWFACVWHMHDKRL